MSTPDIKEVVREKYGQAALRVKSGEGNGCCCEDRPTGSCDPITSNLYDARAFLSGRGINVDEFAKQLEGKFISAFVRANKPASGCRASSGCK